MEWTKTKIAIVSVGVLGVAILSIIQHQAQINLREQYKILQQQQTSLAEQIQQLQHERDDATNQLAALLAEAEQLKSNSSETELLKLRGEVGVLRNLAKENDALRSSNQELKNKLNQENSSLQGTNEMKLPEDIIPPGQMFFSNIDFGRTLEKYRSLNWAEVDVDETAVNLARTVGLTYTNTNSMTRAEAVSALEQVFHDQAGIEISHPDSNHVILKVR
jgi:chromosome segregation ATPase